MGNETNEKQEDNSTPETAVSEGEVSQAVGPAEFCNYFLSQLEGGTVVVPVTAKGDTSFTIFQFGEQRFKISVSAVKRVRLPKGNGVDKEPASELA